MITTSLLLEILGLLSGITSVIGHFPYFRDILNHKTKPERASWLIWTVLGGIAFFSQWAKGATNSLWLTGADTLGVILTYTLALKYGEGGLSRRDLGTLVIASLGVIIWHFTQEAAIALYIVIAVDFSGALLTILKAYENPSSETSSTWFLSGLSGLISLLAVGSLNFTLLIYPLYIWIINWTVVLAIILSPRKS